MSNNKTNMNDRPIWLTSLAEADRDATPRTSVEDRLHSALSRRRKTIIVKRFGAAGLVAVLGVAVMLSPRARVVGLAEPMDETVMDAIAEATGQSADDEADFIPTKLASEQPLESVRVLRVSLPPGALVNYGVVATESSSVGGEVTADLLVGQDGIARAIRVVR